MRQLVSAVAIVLVSKLANLSHGSQLDELAEMKEGPLSNFFLPEHEATCPCCGHRSCFQVG